MNDEYTLKEKEKIGKKQRRREKTRKRNRKMEKKAIERKR